jgi:WD40 repeat protein
VQDILRANCYRCHGEEGASEGGFNFALNLEKLARTLVKPKNAAGSVLYDRLTATDDSAMPPIDEEPRPSAADIATVKAWIEAGAPAVPTEKPRDFVSNDDVLKYILADVTKANERSQRFLRYFTLTHLYNAGVSEDELQTYRNAFAKLLNSLSWNTNLILPEPLDPARTVFRIDIRDLHWSSATWEEIERANPYFLALNTPDARACCEATQAAMPYVRVDWFVFAASKPPLYHAVLSLPATDRELETVLRVNVDANIAQEQAIRAAFNRSGVSQNNRLIEWHKSTYGSYWKSYDFGGNTGRQNLFAYPLGPGSGSDSFQHDGGEIIFSLPNGLQGYLLTDETGRRIDQGPTSIVSDPKRPDKTVTNGVSCMSCHYTGVIPKTDEVGIAVRANRKAYSNADDILALYREPQELNQILEEDGKRFAAAMEKLGITSLSRSGEPISAMAARFEQELDLQLASCEFGVATDDFLQRLDGAQEAARMFASLRVPGGTIKRDMFATFFGRAAVELRLVQDAEGNITASRTTSRTTSSVVSSLPAPRAGLPAERPAPLPPPAERSAEVQRFGDLRWGVDSLAFSPNGAMLAAGKTDGGLLLFDVRDGGRLDAIDKLSLLRQVKSCAFSPSGSQLVVGGGTGQIAIFDVTREGRLKEAGQFAGHSQEVSCIAISHDGRFAISGGKEKRLRYWELATGREQAVFPGFSGAIKACFIARNGRTAMATDGATLLHIDLSRKEVTRQRQLARSWASGQAAAFSADGNMVAVTDTHSIRLWNLNSTSEMPKLEDNETTWAVAFTPDGSRLLSGGSGKVNVWDPRKQRRLHTLETAGQYYVQSLAASPDSKHVAAIPGSAGQVLQVFRIPDAR